jgi:hypothetical protein
MSEHPDDIYIFNAVWTISILHKHKPYFIILNILSVIVEPILYGFTNHKTCL